MVYWISIGNLPVLFMALSSSLQICQCLSKKPKDPTVLPVPGAPAINSALEKADVQVPHGAIPDLTGEIPANYHTFAASLIPPKI